MKLFPNLVEHATDLELPHAESGIMNYHDRFVTQVGNKLVVGYLSDDTDCEDPLESGDGEGSVYSAHRHSGTHSEMQEALALNSYWDPNLELVDDFEKEFRALWIEEAKDSGEFQIWCENNGRVPALIGDYYRRRAARFWREEGMEGADYEFVFTEEVRIKLWAQLRSEGRIGNPDVVVLDVYDHSGVAYSVSGEGMQCRWDTANGGAVWVPDSCAKDEISRRAALYAFGRIVEPRGLMRGKPRYWFQLDEAFGGDRSENFSQWHEAFKALEDTIKARKLKLPKDKAMQASLTRLGRERAAEEICRGVLATYNDWLAGRCYGQVICTFENVAAANDEPEWELVGEESCWGFIGDESAYEEMVWSARNTVKALVKENLKANS